MSQGAEFHDAIWRLKAEMFLAVDEKRWDDFARLFTSDAKIDYSGAARDPGEHIPPIPSLEIYISFARQFVADAQTVHQGATPIIEIISANHIKALWRMEGILVRPTDSPLPSEHTFGIYRDEYRLTADGWRISALAFTLLLALPIGSLQHVAAPGFRTA